jgi:hypothetical protein
MNDSEEEGGELESPAPLDNSARRVLKGTLVPLSIRRADRDNQGLLKFGAVRQLALTPGDVDRVREHLDGIRGDVGSQRERPVSTATLHFLRSFEAPLVPALRPGIADVAAVPTAELIAFSQALVDMRTRQAQALDRGDPSPLRAMRLMQALNTAVVAAQSLKVANDIQPIGMLNLERIEMVPAGIERGELVATIPLAPGEETAVAHKEWSVTSKEFTTIVTDSLEEFSETGVTDNTDLSQSTASQTQHSNQFNITGTVQGGIPLISGSTTTSFAAQDASSQSASESIKHASAITQKASARSRQEHKTTISTVTVTGTEETSTRKIKNSSPTDPIRIDYFSLMRKWRVRLYRFGLRLTYDIVLPEPGASMRRAYMELDLLRQKIGPFDFPVKYSDVTLDLVDPNGNPVPPGAPASPGISGWPRSTAPSSNRFRRLRHRSSGTFVALAAEAGATWTSSLMSPSARTFERCSSARKSGMIRPATGLGCASWARGPKPPGRTSPTSPSTKPRFMRTTGRRSWRAQLATRQWCSGSGIRTCRRSR